MHRFTLSLLTTGVLLASLAIGAQADVSTTTTAVRGRAPVASGVNVINKTNPGVGVRVGDTVEVSYTFKDADGDTDNGTSFRWLRSGSAVSGATGSTYTAGAADANETLAVEVTPKTDSVITDPASGTVVTSPDVAVEASDGLLGNFITPPIARFSQAEGSAYCKNLGARLPTAQELQALYLDATRATVLGGSQANNEMCSVHGWPLSAECGGYSDLYWTSEMVTTSPGKYWVVSMWAGVSGNDYGTGRINVTCVR